MILAVLSALCYVEVMRVANPHTVPLPTRMLSYFSIVLIQVSINSSYKLRIFTCAWRIR
jgi:hypothetical protein